jgi:acetoin utilization deacetylase AcuC-like enzyme
MLIFSSDRFVLPLPDGHRFPMEKYARLREQTLASGIIAPADLREPRAATDAELARAHDPHYVRRVERGELTDKELRRIGFPWSPELGARERLVSGATIEACEAALHDGVAVTLAGGTHHAAADYGAGYCVFNDSAVAVRALQAAGAIARAVIIDCDVHQGDGTALILADDPRCFTFSIHGAKNYPFHKPPSDLDIALPDATDDAMYLAALERGLDQALSRAQADLAIYVAGADPYADDRLGRLALSMAGLEARDRLVLRACRAAGIPVAVSMAGGYARTVADTVAIHLTTVRVAAELAAAETSPR